MARGDHRHLVTLQTPGPPVSDGEGGWTTELVPLDPPTWYVSIEPASQRDMERVAAGTVISAASHLVRGDWHPGVTTQTVVLFEGRTLMVSSVINPEERDVDMTLLCTELVT